MKLELRHVRRFAEQMQKLNEQMEDAVVKYDEGEGTAITAKEQKAFDRVFEKAAALCRRYEEFRKEPN